MRRLVLMTLLAACGLAPQPQLTGDDPGDGVGAWEDLGALSLCLANLRIGPPSAGAGGFCVDQNTPNEAVCSADDECASRERCVCGRCTVPFCSSNAECGAGTACNFGEKRCATKCNSDLECGGFAERCQGGFCKGQCGTDEDCQTAEVCSSMGRCVVADCAAGTDCLAGEICKIQREPRATAEPSVLVVDGELVMWLEMSNAAATQRAIHRATSRDGVHYRLEPADAVLTDAGDARAPSVVATPVGFTLYYETSAGIRRSESSDGIAWGTPTTVITGDFHAPGAAVTPGGETLVFVHAGDRQSIALWRGSGTPTTVYTTADATHPELWRDVAQVGSPFALIETEAPGLPRLRLWYDAFGAESGDSVQFGEIVPLPPNDSIGYAAAPLDDPTALVTWPANPVFDRVVAFLQHRAERSPAVVRAPGGDRWFLYYGAASLDGTEQEGLGVARNPPSLAGE